MHHVRSLFVSLALSLLPCALRSQAVSADNTPQAGTAATAADTVDPQHVMEAFHESVLHHDGARLATLFVPEGGTWFNVLSDDAWARVRAHNPNAPKVRLSGFKDFVHLVSTSKQSLDPRHSHLVLHTDGTIATAYFDYAFFIDGKEENRGSETWQMVKGEAGWRIVAITYSSNPGPKS